MLGSPLQEVLIRPQRWQSGIDQGVLSGMRVFPTHEKAAELMDEKCIEASPCTVNVESMAIFDRELAALDEAVRPYYVLQYGNLLRNRAAVGASTVSEAKGTLN